MNSKNLKIILIILAVTIIASLGILYFSKDKPLENPENNPENIEKEISFEIDFSKAEKISEDQLKILKSDYKSAVEKYKQDPNNFSALMTFAFINYQLGNYESARDIYIRVGKISPGNYNSFWNLANCLIRLKDYSGAEQAYLKAIENGPDQTRHYTALAEIYWYDMPEKKSEIPDLYKKGLAVLPNNYDFLINLASYYKETGDKANALKYFQEVIDNYPEMENEIRPIIKGLK